MPLTLRDSASASVSHTPAMAAAGNYPSAIAVDPAACNAYVANGDYTVSVIPLTHQMR